MSKYAKAVVGAIVAAGAAYLTAISDGVLTGEEIGAVIGALITGLGLVWAVPNSPAVTVNRRD